MELAAQLQAASSEFQSHRTMVLNRIAQLETIIKMAAYFVPEKAQAMSADVDKSKKEVQKLHRSFKGALLNEEPAEDPRISELKTNNKQLAAQNANLKHQIAVLKENAKQSKRDLTHAQGDKETYKLMFEKQVAITSQMAEDGAELGNITETLMKDNAFCRDKIQDLTLENSVLQAALSELEASVLLRERKWRQIFERKQNRESSSS
jgi:hypothetical protein